MDYSIECTDLGVEYRDEGPWRSYELYTQGPSLYYLVMNAEIVEIDQDGGELNTYPMHAATTEVEKAAYMVIEQYLLNKGAKQ